MENIDVYEIDEDENNYFGGSLVQGIAADKIFIITANRISTSSSQFVVEF